MGINAVVSKDFADFVSISYPNISLVTDDKDVIIVLKELAPKLLTRAFLAYLRSANDDGQWLRHNNFAKRLSQPHQLCPYHLIGVCKRVWNTGDPGILLTPPSAVSDAYIYGKVMVCLDHCSKCMRMDTDKLKSMVDRNIPHHHWNGTDI